MRCHPWYGPRTGTGTGTNKPHIAMETPGLTPHELIPSRKLRIALALEHFAQRDRFLSQSQGSQCSHISHLRYPLVFGLSGSTCTSGPPPSSESEHALTHGSSSLLDSGSDSELYSALHFLHM